MDIKRFDQIYEDMRNWMLAHQDKVTDFNDGSVIASFMEAVGREVAMAYIKARSGYDTFLKYLPFSIFEFEQKAGVKAVGQVIFSRSKAYTTVVTIDVGTLISTNSGIQFVTTAVATIASGGLASNAVSIRAVDAGASGNVLQGLIVKIDSSVIGVDSVRNDNPCTGGQDEESETEFKTRFRQYILGLGRTNRYGITTACLSVDNVRSVSIVEHFPPIDNVWNTSVYVDNGYGDAPADVIAAVKSIIAGVGSYSNPGYKAVGINVRVLAPTVVPIALELNLKIDDTVSQEAVEAEIITAMQNYINGLKIGEDVILSRITQSVMKITGIVDLQIVLPAANVVVSDSQIARYSSLTTHYTVVSS
jgi:uncharacterized phage protein gp47/JayE